MNTIKKISAVVLAGGQAQRMGGDDKGLLMFKGRPLIASALERILPQVDEILISANRNLEQYAAFGYPVLSDEVPGYAGPLAGLHRAMQTAAYPLILCVPCDTPFLPNDLVQRLHNALTQSRAQIAVPQVAGRTHHAICLCQRELAQHLQTFLHHGGRRVGEWQAALHHIETPFIDAHGFVNINTPEQLSQNGNTIL